MQFPAISLWPWTEASLISKYVDDIARGQTLLSNIERAVREVALRSSASTVSLIGATSAYKKTSMDWYHEANLSQ